MKILFLTNNTISLPLSDYLRSKGHEIVITGNALTVDYAHQIDPKLTISYCYNRIVPQEIITALHQNVVNLHISYLPWNRGDLPNFWSFWDNTPKGVTLHYIDSGLDTGSIIAQVPVTLSENDTFLNTYNILHKEMQKLFCTAFDQYEYWNKMAIQAQNSKEDKPRKGTYHSVKQLEELIGDNFDWNVPVKTAIESRKKKIL